MSELQEPYEELLYVRRRIIDECYAAGALGFFEHTSTLQIFVNYLMPVLKGRLAVMQDQISALKAELEQAQRT